MREKDLYKSHLSGGQGDPLCHRVVGNKVAACMGRSAISFQKLERAEMATAHEVMNAMYG